MVTKLVDATLAPFAAALNHWPKACGTPPTALELQTVMAMNIRAGKHVLACAMYLRPEGATDQQVRAAAVKLDTKGGNQGVLHNYRRQLEADGLMRRDMSAPRGVYKITLTKKGEAQVARYTKATAPKGDAPVKAAKAAKSRKPRVRKQLPAVPVERPMTAGEYEAATLALRDATGNASAVLASDTVPVNNS